MKMDKLVGERFKERPADCVIDSHALMLRGGYMKYVASGIYSLNTPLRRITKKIETIIRQEMDAIDGQEVLFPVVMPASLWEESGRYETVGSELMRMRDRSKTPLVLGMTHEEAAVQLVREYGNSYLKYPFMIYQIQTKFRDEARPRGGLIRVREFTMKDAYSFHTSQEDLELWYDKCFRAYERIYARVGLETVLSVASDSGMMGGSLSHEFMLPTPVGEDSIAVCGKCGYRANMEAAENIVESKTAELPASLQTVHTPDVNTIEEVCSFLNIPIEKSCKAVVYQKKNTEEYIIVFIRGDYEVNETKLVNYLGAEIKPAVITEECGLCAGYIGPHALDKTHIALFDLSLQGTCNLVSGANREGYHLTGLQLARDCGVSDYRDFAKIKAGGICPKCKEGAIVLSRGIEVGNIFQLGTKYTETMNMQYQDETGELKHPVMGCYGIGVGRLAASVCEEHHDEHGPIWPLSIAPWQVHICCLRADNPAVKTAADKLYRELITQNIEVIYDDRAVSAGVMFSDADLLGVPYRIIISPRNQKLGCCEIVTRDKKFSEKLCLDEAVSFLQKLVDEGNGPCNTSHSLQ